MRKLIAFQALAIACIFYIAISDIGEVSAKVRPLYEITVTSGENGQITPSTKTFRAGASPTFVVKPSNGYMIDSITVDGTDIDLSSVTNLSKPYRYTFKKISSTHTISATFKLIPSYEITVSSGDNGQITPPTKGSYNQGSNAAFVIKPYKGYFIDTITVDDVNIDLMPVKGLAKRYIYKFNDISSAHTLSASFTKISEYPEIRTISGSNGQITPSLKMFSKGSNATFTVTPAEGYVIGAITIDGKYIDPSKVADPAKPYEIKFAELYSDHIIIAIFKAKDADPSASNPFAGHYTGKFTDEGKDEVTITFVVDENGMVNASFSSAKYSIISYGVGLADAEEITLLSGSTEFRGLFSSQDGTVGITEGKWSYCLCGGAVEPPFEACMAPCFGGTWTAQQDKQ